MSGLSDLLVNLLNYVVEQSKETDPNGFKLTGYKEFLRYKPSLAGLPGIDFDKSVEGDHIWMRVDRLKATTPPTVQSKEGQKFITISDRPEGPGPAINETALNFSVADAVKGLSKVDADRESLEVRKGITESLAAYKPLWEAWAEGEKPRRATIGLYGDLFALKHQLESEETAKPHELVWGVGITSWRLPVEGRTGPSAVEFQYPLITQAMEITVEHVSMAIL